METTKFLKIRTGNFRRIKVLFLCLFFTTGPLLAQTITLNMERTSIKTVLQEIQKQTPYRFVYNDALVEVETMTSVSVRNASLETVLKTLFEGKGISYEVKDNQVILHPERQTPPAAGQRQVTGTVVDDATGETLPFVTVRIVGTSTGTVAQDNGTFSITAPTAESVLQFSYVGYETLELRATTGHMAVRLKLASTALEAVVITGYQTISRERATGSYAIIDGDALNRRPSSNISNSLSGVVPGLVTVASNTDGQNRFLVRGRGTLRQSIEGQRQQEEADYQLSMDPLIVVDGIPIQGFTHTLLGGDGFLNSRDPFSTINPNDVESITVLRDAAATSIYGARAANGVIVITTKRGKTAEKVNISVEAFTSIGARPDLHYAFDMASTENTIWYFEHLRKYFPQYQSSWYNPYNAPNAPWSNWINDVARDMLEHYERGGQESVLRAQQAAMIARGDQWEKDLQNHVFRNPVSQQYSIAFRGGSQRHSYSLSANYNRAKMSVIGNSTERFQLNSRNQYNLSDRLSFDFGLNVGLSNATNNGIDWRNIRSSIGPWSRLVDENGDFVHIHTRSYIGGNDVFGLVPNTNGTLYEPIYRNTLMGRTARSWFYNPVADREHYDNTSQRLSARLSGGLNYKINDDFSVSISGQYERNQTSQHSLATAESFFVRNLNNRFSTLNTSTNLYTTNFPAGGIFQTRGDLYEGYMLRGQANYNKTFGRHDIVTIAGTEVNSSTQVNDPTMWRYGYNPITNAVSTSLDYVSQQRDLFHQLTNSPFIAPGTLVTFEDRFFSAYANVAYTFDDKYSITGSARTDASNYQSLTMREKFSPFWSVGGSWLLSREDFMRGINWVDFLKLRMSFGEAGLAAGKGLAATVTTLGNVATNQHIFNNFEEAAQISVRGNPLLTWEKSRTFDIGTEFRLWRNKLYGSLSYYNKLSYDVLTNASVPIISQGVTTSTFNNATISNKGIELTIGSRMNITRDLDWNGSLNLSYNQNKIVDYFVVNNSQRPAIFPGFAMNSIWALRAVGHDKNGFIILENADGRRIAATNSVTMRNTEVINGAGGQMPWDSGWIYNLGHSAATIPTQIGFTNTFTYKGFTLSFLITGKFGYWVHSQQIYAQRQDAAHISSALNSAVDAYKKGFSGLENTFIGYPMLDENAVNAWNAASWFMYGNMVNLVDKMFVRGDHIRLNEIFLGYELPNKVLGNVSRYIHGVNFYIQARNLGTIWTANNLGIDPDYLPGNPAAGTSGATGAMLGVGTTSGMKPTPTYTFGVKFNMN